MGKQTELPGVEVVRLPAVTKAARAYITARDERMELTEVEVERKQQLLSAMKNAEIERYRCDGVEVWIEPGDEKVKAKKLDGEDG